MSSIQRYGIFAQSQVIDLNINAAVIVSNTVIRIPVQHVSGTLQQTGNCGVTVFDNTLSQTLGTSISVTGSSIAITFTGTTTYIGLHQLTISTGQSARGTLFDSKTTARNRAYSYNAWMPVNMILNFGGSNADPSVAGTISVWNNVKQFTDKLFTLQGNVIGYQINTLTNFWGFASGANPAMAGNTTVTGVNYYDNAVIGSWIFTEGNGIYAEWRQEGLNPNKLYTIRCAGCRPGVAGTRNTTYTIGASGITKTSNRSGTASIYTLDSENAKFNSVAPSIDGKITIRVSGVGTDGTFFGYLNAIQFTESP
jgi:hypothetical protein